jgi:hypothetical protein
MERMTKGRVRVETPDEFMFVAAFRYALGRRTYAVSLVIGELRRFWPALSTNTRVLIMTEIDRARERDERDNRYPGWLGDACDREEWLAFRAWAGDQEDGER